ncbi:hypothetical protein FRB96_007554 [Tulasnella sp. 330]|nr:hypothetical protein FRB96_007554 [Tulasnella sp. 330]KAG8882024.1 hypothetical protein FRB97_008798 [Tulasnella sp. 331]
MSRVELFNRLKNNKAKARSYNLEDWECAPCRTALSMEDAIVIDDSDEEVVPAAAAVMPMQRQTATIELVNLAMDTPAFDAPQTPARPPEPLGMREESSEIILVSPSPPPPALTRSNATHPLFPTPAPASDTTASRGTGPSTSSYATTTKSISVHRPEADKNTPPNVLEKLGSFPRRDQGTALPPQDVAFRAHANVNLTQAPPSTVSIPQSRPAALSERPEDNLRSRYRPPRTRNVLEGPMVARRDPLDHSHNGQVPMEPHLSREEVELLDSFAHVKIETQDEGFQNPGRSVVEEEGELDVSEAGWPEGYVEPSLDDLYVRRASTALGSSYFSVTAAFNQSVRTALKKSRDSMFPRFDIFYQDFPNPGDIPVQQEAEDRVVLETQGDQRRRGRKAESSRLLPEVVGPEVIYVAIRPGQRRP